MDGRHRSSTRMSRLVVTVALALVCAAATGSPVDSATALIASPAAKSASKAQDLAVVRDHGVRFYRNAGGMPLLVHSVGHLGQRWLKVSVVPRTLDLRSRAVCLWQGTGFPRGSIAHFSMFVNGHRVEDAAGYCMSTPRRLMPLEGASTLEGDTAQHNKARWARLGVKVGEQMQITLHMQKGVNMEQSRLVFGLYRAAPRGHVRTAHYQTKVVFRRHEYKAGRVQVQRFTGRHWVLPASLRGTHRPYFVLGGTLRAHQYGTLFLRPGDHGSIGAASPRARVADVIRSGRGPARVTYRTADGSASGLLWMVVYHETR